MENGKSAQFIGVGRLGLEPRTYGLKVDGSYWRSQRSDLVFLMPSPSCPGKEIRAWSGS